MYKIFHRLISLVQPNLRTAALHSKVNVARRSASVCVQDRFVCLDLEDGNGQMVNHKYPSIWLRDNCQCPTCYHSPSKSRIINWQSTNINILPKRVKVSIINNPKISVKSMILSIDILICRWTTCSGSYGVTIIPQNSN